ncbi:MAG: FCD domain-containing protein [Sphingomonas adhaesiva]|uniref:FadR/GntR family transcriptional regulator n=1 Tax=Sphingomonas adhaesiva TaxID=28212 RepID=UPI002FF86C3E
MSAIDAGGSLADHAARRVREHIRAHDLKVGDPLPGEGWFAADLGVSRAVIREAFGALAALRLIDVANGRRARVGAIDGSVMATSIEHAVATAQVSVAEVWDVRRTLEMRTAELAARHRTPADADEIARAADAMVAAGDALQEVTRHDIAFHQAIARASGNALFRQIVRSFEPLMTVAVPVAWRTRVTPEQRSDILRTHQQIADAIHRGDAAAAAAAMDAHFVASISELLDR